MKKFQLLPLTLAMGAAFVTQAHADESAFEVVLATEYVNIDRQGTKVKTNVVTAQKKDESTDTNLRDLLKEEPAIHIGGGTGASQFLTIRGMGQNSVDVKVDNAYSDSQILYHQGRFILDPSLVKIVSVQKGAGSASAGIGATNGSIVAKTVDAQDLLKEGQDIGFKVGAGYSSNDERSYNAAAYGRAGNFDFLIAGNKVDQDNYKAGEGYVNYLGGDTVPSTDLDKVSYLAKLGANFGDHRFVLSHLNQTDKGVRNVREEFDIKSLECNPPQTYRLSICRQDPRYRELSLTQTNLEWTGKNLGFADEATANIYMMENKRESEGGEQYGRVPFQDPATGQAIVIGHNETKVETKGANINFDTYANDDVLVKYGLNYRHQEITPNYTPKATDLINRGSNARPNWQPFGTDIVNQEKTDTGAYVEIIGEIGNVTATAGLRYDHFNFKAMDGKEVSNSDLNPSVGLIWQATPELSLSAVHNHATRSPRLYDALRSGNSLVSIADGVKAEKAKNTEVGFNYNNGNLSLNGSYFWQKIDDLLVSGRTSEHDSTIAINNAGYAKNAGWELGASYRHGGLTARVGVAESDPEFYTTRVFDYLDNNGQTQTAIPSFDNREYSVLLGRTYTAGLAYRFANPNLEVGVNYRKTDDVSGAPWKSNPDYDASAFRDGYDTTDVYANWKPYGNDRMNVNFAINNISDEYYIPQTLAGGSGLPGVGREYRVGVNYTF